MSFCGVLWWFYGVLWLKGVKDQLGTMTWTCDGLNEQDQWSKWCIYVVLGRWYCKRKEENELSLYQKWGGYNVD